MIVDVHTHLSTAEQWGPQFQAAIKLNYPSGTLDIDVTPERHWQSEQRADRVIVFGINSVAMEMHTPNDQIAAYVRQHPDKLIGFMSIDPNQPDAIDELERCVADLGLCGIKMSPVYQHYHPSDPKAARVHTRAQELGLPILTHSAFQGMANTPMEWASPILYDAVAREFPDLKIILAHIGLPWFADAMVVARKHPNVFTDVSGLNQKPWWLYQALALFLEVGSLDKVLFGSDMPFSTVDGTIDMLHHVNDTVAGTALPKIPLTAIDAIIHRDSLNLLGLT